LLAEPIERPIEVLSIPGEPETEQRDYAKRDDMERKTERQQPIDH
jgi:hypothetical protein